MLLSTVALLPSHQLICIWTAYSVGNSGIVKATVRAVQSELKEAYALHKKDNDASKLNILVEKMKCVSRGKEQEEAEHPNGTGPNVLASRIKWSINSICTVSNGSRRSKSLSTFACWNLTSCCKSSCAYLNLSVLRWKWKARPLEAGLWPGWTSFRPFWIFAGVSHQTWLKTGPK